MFLLWCHLIFCSKKCALKVPQKTIQMKSDDKITFCVRCWRSHTEWLHNDSFIKQKQWRIFGSYIARAFMNHFPLVLYQGRYIYYQFCSIKWCSSIWCKGMKNCDFKQHMWFLKMYISFERFGFYSSLFWVQLLEYKVVFFVRNDCAWEEDLWFSALL